MLDPIGSRRIGRYRESERPFSCSTSSDWSPAISPASFSRSRYDTIGSSTARLLLRRTDTWLCCGPKASPESPLKSNGATGFRRTYGITVVNERRTRGLCLVPHRRAGSFQRAIGTRDSKPLTSGLSHFTTLPLSQTKPIVCIYAVRW